jgi:tRNA(fMet)-specific endonuclease VapC
VLVLDTDHLAEIDRNSVVGRAAIDRLRRSSAEIATTIVSIEEQLRGWLSVIARWQAEPHRQIDGYTRLQSRFEFYSEWIVLPWTSAAADTFVGLRKQKLRVGTMDLKIASIVLSQNATLLTRNLGDFSKVPGLRIENWL